MTPVYTVFRDLVSSGGVQMCPQTLGLHSAKDNACGMLHGLGPEAGGWRLM